MSIRLKMRSAGLTCVQFMQEAAFGKTERATLKTVVESAASAAASSLTCISVFRTKTLALPSGPLCLRLDRCARVWAAIICVWMAVRVSGPP